jgi:hypothetical protein
MASLPPHACRSIQLLRPSTYNAAALHPCVSALQVMNAWLAPSLPLTMSESELQGIKVCLAAVWQHVVYCLPCTAVLLTMRDSELQGIKVCLAAVAYCCVLPVVYCLPCTAYLVLPILYCLGC